MDISVVARANRQYRPAYRAYNKHTKQMVYCFPKCSPQVAFILTPDGWGMYPSDVPLRDDNCLANMQDSILLRGTGRQDAMALEIYEGDIVKNLTSTCDIGQGLQFMYAEVYYQDGVFYENYFHEPIYSYPNLEVVGNKYEHPDLMQFLPYNLKDEE